MKTWTYSWIIYPFVFSIAYCVGFFNTKVRKTLELRAWKDFLSLRFNAGEPIEYWIHVASQGELEYAIPIIQRLAEKKQRVLITYFSISAKKAVEELPSKYPNVSLVVPLPHDGLGLMKEFVKLVHKQGTRKLLLLKYELWPGLLWECNRNGIKVYLVDALKPGWFHRKLLHKLDGILSGYETEVADVDHKNVVVLGDTRVERVVERLENFKLKLSVERIQQLKNKKFIILGSMWPKDDELFVEALKNMSDRPNLIWVPHELDAGAEASFSSKLKSLGYGHFVWEDLETAKVDATEKNILVTVMQKGMLSEIYRLGSAAYVGGGFGSGVHSVWEPTISGNYVACGPKIERSPEARLLKEKGILEKIESASQLKNWLEVVFKKDNRSMDLIMKEVLQAHKGASARIVDYCNTN